MPTALLTGAGSGIGEATAGAMAEAGWTVYATDIGGERVSHLADVGCTTLELDVTDRSAIRSVVEQMTSEVGRIDCLVNNAGYGQMGPVEDVPIERMEQQFDVNYWGPIRCIKAVLPVMREQGSGTIINVSSVMGRVVTPGWGTYAGSKHALEGLSDALRMEVAEQGVDVVLVEPAWVATNFADRVSEQLSGFGRTDCYSRIYEALENRGLVDGELLSVSPERVATELLAIAESTSPSARCPVGLGARAVLLSRYLPRSIQDRLQAFVLDYYSDTR